MAHLTSLRRLAHRPDLPYTCATTRFCSFLADTFRLVFCRFFVSSLGVVFGWKRQNCGMSRVCVSVSFQHDPFIFRVSIYFYLHTHTIGVRLNPLYLIGELYIYSQSGPTHRAHNPTKFIHTFWLRSTYEFIIWHFRL